MHWWEFEVKASSVMLVVEAIAYLALAGWVLNRVREGRWAMLVAVGAGLVAVALGLNAFSFAELIFLDSTHIFDAVLLHEHSNFVLTTTQTLGALLLVAGVVLSRGSPPTRDPGSIYGPE